jgi:hypothetical protein
MRSSTFARVLGILALAIVAGGLIGWWASRNTHPTQPQPPAPQSSAPVAVTPSVEPTPIPKPATNGNGVIAAPTEVASNTNAFDPALWDDKLDEILGDGDDDTDRKARQLLDMMDKVSVEAQTEIAGHIVNLVDDKDFAERAAKYLTNAEVPEAVSSVFMDDLYNRDEEMKLPLLLAVARNDKHALKDEAKDLLELYIEEDYGTNWNQWEEATKKYLKEHAAEEAPVAAQP